MEGKEKEKGTGEGKRGRWEGRGSLARGKEGSGMDQGDKSPAWSSQDFGSTVVVYLYRMTMIMTVVLIQV